MITQEKNIITQKLIDEAYSYPEYVELTAALFKDNRTTNGETGDDWLEYTKLNLHRMARLDKTTVVDEDTAGILKNYPRKITWLVLTEGWCGDAAQILPVLNKMAALSPNIELRLILRDEHPEVMDQYLTNGKSRSIPKLVALDSETLEELGTWGPRPAPIQNLFEQMTANSDNDFEDVKKDMQLWYNRDNGATIIKEIKELLSEWR